MEDEEERESDFNYESQAQESTDDEEDDEEAKAWLEAHPSRTLSLHSLPRRRYTKDASSDPEKADPLTYRAWYQSLYQDSSRRQISDTDVVSLESKNQWGSGDDQRTESWRYLHEEVDSSQDLATSKTRIDVREEGSKMTDLPSKKEGTFLTHSENQVKEPKKDLLCSPLLVIQDNFASADLPLLTCLTQDQEFGPDTLFQKRELDFAPLREIPGKSEEPDWFSRPSEVSEALFQATSEVASDLGTKEEAFSSEPPDLKTFHDAKGHDLLASYISWKMKEIEREQEASLADKNQVSISTSSDTSDEYITLKGSENVDTSSSYMQYWKQEALQQSENYLTKGLQGKTESDIYALDDFTECCSLDENVVVCSERVALQKEICEQDDLISECIELESSLDLETCDTSLNWQTLSQPSSKEESNFEAPVGKSASKVPQFAPHGSVGESEYYTSDLRMLRITPGTLSKPLKHSAAWNLKFNLAHGYEGGYSISELNEDDRRKVEEIKAKLFAHGRTTDLSKGLQSPRGISCNPEAVCGHIIIESHEKGCFRTLSAEQPQLDSRPCVFRSTESSEMIRGLRSPSSWRARQISLCNSLEQNKPNFKVWNSVRFQDHAPFQTFSADDFKISSGVQMPFHERMDPWLSELVEPSCVPPEEMGCYSPAQVLPPEPMKQFTTAITFSSHRHSKCFSDAPVFKVGVPEGSQCPGASVGAFNSRFPEEQNLPRDLKQKICSPSSYKTISPSPGKAVTILTGSGRQSHKLPVEHSHQEEKLLEIPGFRGSHSEPSVRAKSSNVKEVHFSDNHILVSTCRPSSTVAVKEKNVTVTPDLPSHIFLEQRELYEQCAASHTDHHEQNHHSPPLQHENYVVPNLPCYIFLEKQELSEQSKAPNVDQQVRENHFPVPQDQGYIAPDLPSSIFLEQRELLEQSSKAPDVAHLTRKHHSPLPECHDYEVEKNAQQKPKSHTCDMTDEANFNNAVSLSASNQGTSETSASSPPLNRKVLSYVRITLGPKPLSKLESGTSDKKFNSLDPSKTRLNCEFNGDLQTMSSRSLEPNPTLVGSKHVIKDQECLGHKSSLDLQVVLSPFPDCKTQDLKAIPFQNSQLVTSRQTQVSISDLESYSSPEGTSVSADRSSEETKTSYYGKSSSDAVTQITTESPEKTTFSSEIFINADNLAHGTPDLSTQGKLDKVPGKFASSSSIQQISHSREAQPSLLPYKPSSSAKMFYVPQLSKLPPTLDSRSDTTVESTHSGSNDAIAPDFPAQVLGTRDDNQADTVNIKHKEGIYSKRAVTKKPLPNTLVTAPPPEPSKISYKKNSADAQVQVAMSKDEIISDKMQKEEVHSKLPPPEDEDKESLQKDTTGSSDSTSKEQLLKPVTKTIKHKEEIYSKKKTVCTEAWSENKESLHIGIAGSGYHSEVENTTHSVFKSAKFYFHHPVHLPSEQDFCHESLGRSIFMRHSWKDCFPHHSEKHREHICLSPPHQNVEKTKTDYTRIESLSINVNLENKETVHTTKNQIRDSPRCDEQISDDKKDHDITTQHPVSLNELWNKYLERQKKQKRPEFSCRKELSLVERLDRLARLIQNPISHSLRPSESTQDESRGEQNNKEWSRKQQQLKNKLQKKKRCKGVEKCHKNIDLKRSRRVSAHQVGKSNQIKIEQIKFDKYILSKQPGGHYLNTSSDSRPSEESDPLTDTATNILSTTTSPVDSDILTHTDKEVTLRERSSSISTIDTARLVQAFGHERVYLSPRQIKLYNSIIEQQRRYLEKRSKKNKKALNIGHPQMTSEHTRRKHVQATKHMNSSESVTSTSSLWSSYSALYNSENVQMLNKGVQAGNLEIVNGVRKNTRDVGMTFPTPSSSEARVEEDSDGSSWSEEKIEKRLLASYLGDKRLRKNKYTCCAGISWFVPVENVKSNDKKENLPKYYGPGISWFAPLTNTKPWREPLREQNWQEHHMDSHRAPAGLGRDPPKPFVKATLQESLWLHRPDFISRSGERIKRLKLIVQERKLQNMLQSEREALFNTMREWKGYRKSMCLPPKQGFIATDKNRPVGKKEMIQRSKRIYEQLPEVRKKREEEKRKSEYKSYRLQAQLYKKKVTNQLLGRKVPWN